MQTPPANSYGLGTLATLGVVILCRVCSYVPSYVSARRSGFGGPNTIVGPGPQDIQVAQSSASSSSHNIKGYSKSKYGITIVVLI